MRTLMIALAAAGAAIAATPAAAQAPAATAADRADARCLILLQAVAQDPQRKEAAARGIYFYLGRVAARGPLSRMATVIPAEARAIPNQQQAQAELTRCGSELERHTKEFQAVIQKFAPPRPAGQPPAKK